MKRALTTAATALVAGCTQSPQTEASGGAPPAEPGAASSAPAQPATPGAPSGSPATAPAGEGQRLMGPEVQSPDPPRPGEGDGPGGAPKTPGG